MDYYEKTVRIKRKRDLFLIFMNNQKCKKVATKQETFQIIIKKIFMVQIQSFYFVFSSDDSEEGSSKEIGCIIQHAIRSLVELLMVEAQLENAQPINDV